MEDNNNLNFVSTTAGLVQQDPKKRRASKACIYCNRSHMSCEDGNLVRCSLLLTKIARPCKRCSDRGIAHLCRDSENRKRRGRKGTYLWADLQPTPATGITTPVFTPVINSPPQVVLAKQADLQPTPATGITTVFTPVPVTPTPDLDMDLLQLNPELKGLFLELFLSSNDNNESNHLISMHTNCDIPSTKQHDVI
jgi:hypothetical protein